MFVIKLSLFIDNGNLLLYLREDIVDDSRTVGSVELIIVCSMFFIEILKIGKKINNCNVI